MTRRGVDREMTAMKLCCAKAAIAVSCLLNLASSGCGTSAYNTAVTKRLDALRREAPYAALSAPTEIPGTSVKIGMPKVLTRFITPETEDAGGLKGKISAERVKFAPLKLPGVFCAYDAEGELNDGSKTPMACQIAIIPKSAPEAQQFAAGFETGLKLMFPKQAATFQAVEAETPGGDKKVPWKMLHIDGELNFDVYPKDPNAQMQFKKLPAVVEIWWHESDAYHTLLFWRVAKEVNDKVSLINLAKLSAGTIFVGPPPEAKPAEAKPGDAKPAAAPAAK